MKNWFLFTFLLFTNILLANNDLIVSTEFVQYHLQTALDEIENQDIFDLIQKNIDNLKNRGSSNDSANELINLIEEGHKIDPYNMSKLIETLTYKDASNNAKVVIIKAIEHDSSLTFKHMFCLIQTLAHSDASNNATDVIIAAIEHGVKFGAKERLLLAEISNVVNAKKNVERIRKALHEKQIDI